MALIEVEESELAESKSLANTLRALMGNPGARRKVLEAQKIVRPDAVIPELDAAKPILDEVSALRTEMQKWQKDQEEKQAKATEAERMTSLKSKWQAGQSLAKEQGYTAEGLTALEKFMEERGIADHEVAIPYFEKINPPAKPEIPSNKGFSIFNPTASEKEDGMQMLLQGQDDRYISTVVPNILSDIRSNIKGR